MSLLRNAFARPLYAIAPELAALPGIMRNAGAESVAISGAGPAHYAGHRWRQAGRRRGAPRRATRGPRPGLHR